MKWKAFKLGWAGGLLAAATAVAGGQAPLHPASPAPQASPAPAAVLDLQAKGFKNVACLLGGLNAWRQAGGEMVMGGGR
jgi:hypothetical protein